MNQSVMEIYGNQLRLRACGLGVQAQKLIMINHKSLYEHDFWSPPGGGVHFGEPAKDCLKREFKEETGLEVEAGDFLFACEFINHPLHAVELFFSVEIKSGLLESGDDPEMNMGQQIIHDVKFLSWNDIKLMPKHTLHGIFRYAPEPSKIMGLRGYFRL